MHLYLATQSSAHHKTWPFTTYILQTGPSHPIFVIEKENRIEKLLTSNT